VSSRTNSVSDGSLAFVSALLAGHFQELTEERFADLILGKGKARERPRFA
jgi:hypothetical protein